MISKYTLVQGPIPEGAQGKDFQSLTVNKTEPPFCGVVELLEGRAIPVLRVGENVVWFDFAAICDGPRSPADYIEIARDYQSVLVSGVPIFDETRENAARRFISLVDEFYDRNVNLIVSAAASPRELYRGDRLQQEFHRTTSRLIEMQSEEYLAREHRA